MAYNILGINPGHNGSACLISDGNLVYYLEEERLSKKKYDYFPLRSILEILNLYSVDEAILVGNNYIDPHNILYENILKKFTPHIHLNFFGDKHHLSHASNAFYSSGFKEALIIVVDGAGSYLSLKDAKNSKKEGGWETESVYTAKYPNNFNLLFKNLGNNGSYTNIVENYHFNNTPNIVKCYEAVTKYLGFEPLEAGKTMGLSSYGKPNSKIPQLLNNLKGNKNFFLNDYPTCAYIDVYNNNEFLKNDFLLKQDLAYSIQKESQNELKELVAKYTNLTKINNVCISGGYGLNCVNNYFLKKSFPNINFYIDPTSHDGGTCIGASKYFWYNKTKSKKHFPLKKLYLGPKRQIQITEKYKQMFNIYNIQPKDVAQLISERNIVTIFQGRSEAGPRALGNRSILYDPTDPNGKDFVNQVKKREWFRPFAGTVLLEKANEWFDMAGLEESPFMMYAMDVWPDKQEQIQAITHVDGTCRIQTVTEEQNPHYYKLIQEFEKITGVPILFNTSFNLAGDPLVETIEDALETMLKSEMKYMYVPELGYLLEKK